MLSFHSRSAFAALIFTLFITSPLNAHAQNTQHAAQSLSIMSREQLNAMAEEALAALNGGDTERAARLFATILDQLRQIHPAGHQEIDVALFNLTSALRNLGRYDEAEPLALELLALRRAAVPPRPLDVADALDALAKTISMRGRAGAALTLNQEALAIREAHLPAGDAGFVESWTSTALTLEILDRPIEAEGLLRRALAVTIATKGADHEDTQTIKYYLAETLMALARYHESMTLSREVLENRRRLMPQSSPLLASAVFAVGSRESVFGDRDLGIALLTEALALQRQTLGIDSAKTVLTLNALSGSLQLANRPAEAEPYSKQALVIARKTREPTDYDLSVALLFHAALLLRLNRLTEALELTEEALNIETQKQPGYGDFKSSVRVGRAAILQRMSRPADSYQEIRKVGEELLAGPGSTSGLDREARAKFDRRRDIFTKQIKLGWESAHLEQ